MRALFDTAAERLCETRPAPTNRFLPPTKLRAAGGGSGLPASVRVEDRESRAQSGGGKGGNHRGNATLDDLRGEIDEIDGAIHDLLMRRAALAEYIAALKETNARAERITASTFASPS